MRANRSPGFWFLYAAIVAVAMLAYFVSTRANATEKPAATPTQSQSQSQANAQTVNAGGGQGGGASNQLGIEGDRTTAIGLSTTSPIPVAMEGGVLPPCWLPTKARSYFFGAFAASSKYQRDPECIKDLEAVRAHELAMETARTERARAESATCSEIVSRGVEACVSKGE
jgi:hypothetical protein